MIDSRGKVTSYGMKVLQAAVARVCLLRFERRP
jgi:hypothetical protein